MFQNRVVVVTGGAKGMARPSRMNSARPMRTYA